MYLVTNGGRATHCFLGWKIVWERSRDDLQAVVDEGPKAKWYYNDGYETYASLWYHFGRSEVSEGKSETCSVEADNAELRTISLVWQDHHADDFHESLY